MHSPDGQARLQGRQAQVFWCLALATEPLQWLAYGLMLACVAPFFLATLVAGLIKDLFTPSGRAGLRHWYASSPCQATVLLLIPCLFVLGIVALALTATAPRPAVFGERSD